jgi:hypothetical protein
LLGLPLHHQSHYEISGFDSENPECHHIKYTDSFKKELYNFEILSKCIQRTLSTARDLPVGHQSIRGIRISLRPDVLCAMTSHPVVHMLLTLQWNSLGRALLKVHESQRDVRLGKLIVTLNYNYPR